MAEITCRHEIDCSIADYWEKCVFNNAFNQELYVGRLHFHSFVPSESVNSADRRTKKCTMEPPLTGIPGPAKKLIGDALKYAEDGYLDKKTMRYRSTIVPSTFAEKTKVEAELLVRAFPERRREQVRPARAGEGRSEGVRRRHDGRRDDHARPQGVVRRGGGVRG